MKNNRTFFPGDSWLYLKIYLSIIKSNHVLIGGIIPSMKLLYGKQIITKWFYVRFEDPNPHIRLRMYLFNKEMMYYVIKNVKEFLNPFIESKIVYNISIETYQREIERYGHDRISICEDCFHIDTIATCIIFEKFIDHEISEIIEATRRMHTYFEYTKLNIEERYKICKLNALAYMKEQHIDSYVSLDKQYRLFKRDIERTLISQWNPFDKDVVIFSSPKLDGLWTALRDDYPLLSAIIHMSINRLCCSNQRMLEMQTYYYLMKFYLSLLHRCQK